MRNHRIVVSQRGGPEVLRVVEEDLPEPQPGEVRVRVLTAGVSAFDLMIRSGWFPGFPSTPFTPGADIVGEVEKLGAGRVHGRDRAAHRRRTVSRQRRVHRVSLPARRRGGAGPGRRRFGRGGLPGRQLPHRGPGAAHRQGEDGRPHPDPGCRQAAWAPRSSSSVDWPGWRCTAPLLRYNHELVSAMGATPIDYRTENVVERIRSLTGDGVDAVFDPIGGARQLWRSNQSLRKGGRLVWFGVAATSKNGIRVIPITLADRRPAQAAAGRQEGLARRPTSPLPPSDSGWSGLLDSLEAGQLHPVVADTHSACWRPTGPMSCSSGAGTPASSSS